MLTNESMMNSTMMCDNFIHDMELVMNKWNPKQRYYLDKVKKENKKDRKAGIFNPVTNE